MPLAAYNAGMKNDIFLGGPELATGVMDSVNNGQSLPPAIMVLGTASHAGKSLLTAGLCRLLTRKGLSVAPFKAQNMALNSAVTPSGGEIGRAQALQAQACGLLPDERMNPILLKPHSDRGSQVVVLGQARGHADVYAYDAMKPALFEDVCRAYASLAQGRDVMVLEGAGSPAEINLKARDIVNTRMAREARARALLVGDIDRGGVFAALLGTLALLDPWEQDLVVGLVVNKFRGDPSLLPPALDAISARTGKSFLGVIPWLPDLGLPEEDSMGLRYGTRLQCGLLPEVPHDELDVAVVDLPRVGNIVDIDPLCAEPGVRVRLVSRAEELGQPDLIILPGSKSTVSDLRHIRSTGLAEAILQRIASDSPQRPEVLGICAGLQMLGLRIEDPLGLEEAAGHVESGLGLLPLVTRMDAHKILRRAQYFDTQQIPLRGYEIHHGRSVPSENFGPESLQEWMRDDAGQSVGWHIPVHAGGHIWATYTHGLFDDDVFRAAFLNQVRRRRHKRERPTASYSLEPGLDRLADTLEEHLDISGLLP